MNALLVCIGIVIHPSSAAGSSGLLSLVGPALILAAYFAVGQHAGRVTSPIAQLSIRIGAISGLAAGCVSPPRFFWNT